LSEKMKNNIGVQANIKKVSEMNVGRKYSEEHRQNISKALTGVKLSSERVERMRIASTGKKQSPETIAKRMESKHKPIMQLTMTGEVVREWKSATHVEMETNGEYKRKCLYGCLQGRYGKKSYKNYRWKYKKQETT